MQNHRTANLRNTWKLSTYQGEKFYSKNKKEKAGGICCINISIKNGNETVHGGSIKCFEASTEYRYGDCEIAVEEMVLVLLEETAVVMMISGGWVTSDAFKRKLRVALTAISRHVNTLQRPATWVATTTEGKLALFMWFCTIFFTYK